MNLSTKINYFLNVSLFVSERRTLDHNLGLLEETLQDQNKISTFLVFFPPGNYFARTSPACPVANIGVMPPVVVLVGVCVRLVTNTRSGVLSGKNGGVDSVADMHTYTRTYIHTFTHASAYTYTNSHAYTHANIHVHTYRHKHAHSDAITPTHPRTHIHTHVERHKANAHLARGL